MVQKVGTDLHLMGPIDSEEETRTRVILRQIEQSKPELYEWLSTQNLMAGDDGRILCRGRYGNSGARSCSIVAVLSLPSTFNDKGWGGDWAVYWGSTQSEGFREVQTHQHTAKRGVKMSKADADYFFSGLSEILPYRE